MIHFPPHFICPLQLPSFSPAPLIDGIKDGCNCVVSQLFKPFQDFIDSLHQALAVNGSVGEKDIFKNRRIIFVNGILNTSDDCLETANEISEIFGGSKIYFTYNPSHGLMGDISNMIRGVFFGSFLYAATKLAENIQERIQDLKSGKIEGGPKEKRRVILLAHSGGGVILKLAMSLLSVKEMKKISVYTFGSGVVFSDDNFHKATNYISKSDPIPLISHLLQGHLLWYPGKVEHLGTYLNYPGSTHKLLSCDYKEALVQVQSKLTTRELRKKSKDGVEINF